jgi:hypothetical protein
LPYEPHVVLKRVFASQKECDKKTWIKLVCAVRFRDLATACAARDHPRWSMLELLDGLPIWGTSKIVSLMFKTCWHRITLSEPLLVNIQKVPS